MDTRTGPYFETILEDNFYAKFGPFCSALNITTSKEIIDGCSRIAVRKVRASQGCIDQLPPELAEFKSRYLSEAAHSTWTNEEKIHLYALRLMVQNRNQASLCFQLLNTQRDATAAENIMRRIRLFE